MSAIPRRAMRVSGVVAAAALVLTGCLSNPNAGGGTTSGGSGGGVVDGGSTDGDKKVTILGAFGGPEEKAFNASLTAFEQSSGIDIQYTPDQDFTTTIKQKVGAGDSPDIGLFPQPGGLLELAGQKKIEPIDTYLDYEKLDATLLPGLLDSARSKGRVYGAPMRNAAKSIVWYPKKAYEAGGYSTEPASMQELDGITDKIKASGVAPWCMGWESDQATGWVGTDWIEETVLRMYGPDVYDDWIYHRIPFNDERIVKAFDEYAKIAKDEDKVLGGPKGILNTAFGEAMTPAFSTPPKCMLMRQGNFAISFFPANINKDLDNEIGIYAYPTFEGGFKGRPMLGGGDLAALFNGNDDDAKKVMQFITSDKFGAEWAKSGGWLSPHKTFDGSNYPNETTRTIAKLAIESDVVVFDGSDVMPKSIGSDVFWKEMVKWLNGQSSKQTADNIEAAWPKS